MYLYLATKIQFYKNILRCFLLKAIQKIPFIFISYKHNNENMPILLQKWIYKFVQNFYCTLTMVTSLVGRTPKEVSSSSEIIQLKFEQNQLVKRYPQKRHNKNTLYCLQLIYHDFILRYMLPILWLKNFFIICSQNSICNCYPKGYIFVHFRFTFLLCHRLYSLL